MTRLNPIKRKDLIKKLRKFGFEGPFIGGKHEFMIKSETRLILPNPHQSDIGVELLSRILKQAGINKEDWVNVRI